MSTQGSAHEDNAAPIASPSLLILLVPVSIFLINAAYSRKNFSFYNENGNVSQDGGITLMCAACVVLVLSVFFCNKISSYCATHCNLFAVQGSKDESTLLLEPSHLCTGTGVTLNAV